MTPRGRLREARLALSENDLEFLEAAWPALAAARATVRAAAAPLALPDWDPRSAWRDAEGE